VNHWRRSRGFYLRLRFRLGLRLRLRRNRLNLFGRGYLWHRYFRLRRNRSRFGLCLRLRFRLGLRWSRRCHLHLHLAGRRRWRWRWRHHLRSGNHGLKLLRPIHRLGRDDRTRHCRQRRLYRRTGNHSTWGFTDVSGWNANNVAIRRRSACRPAASGEFGQQIAGRHNDVGYGPDQTVLLGRWRCCRSSCPCLRHQKEKATDSHQECPCSHNPSLARKYYCERSYYHFPGDRGYHFRCPLLRVRQLASVFDSSASFPSRHFNERTRSSSN
jgi:hypothetical protein